MLFLFFAFGLSTFFDTRCVNYKFTDRALLLGCFSQLIDTNHDNILNASEIHTFNNACCSTWSDNAMTPEDYFTMTCDMNHDNQLDINDWNHRHACCKSEGCLVGLCNFCYEHGWTGPPTKK